uniref:Uncharacterized protein n=1 Tax=Arundo donax TaxID=35708 RepID=A0A0A8ZN91_ARUDO
MWYTTKPSSSIANKMRGGGGAPPVMTRTGPGRGLRSAAGALTIMFSTVGAPPMCVTL